MEKWHKENSEQIRSLKSSGHLIHKPRGFQGDITELLGKHRNINSKLPVMVRDMPVTETGMPA